jgi:hypothetical protein
MSLTLTGAGLHRPPAGGGLPPVLTYVGDVFPETSYVDPTITYTAVPIGTASGFTTRRIIIVGTASGVASNGSLTNVSINGISATIHIESTAGAENGGEGHSFIASLPVPTGTTADITLTIAGGIFSSHVLGIYTVDDALLVSTTPSVGSNFTTSAVTTLTTSSFTQTAGGFVIAVGSLSTAPASGLAITGYTTNQFGGANSVILASLTSIGSTGSAMATANWVSSLSGNICAAAWQ